jgi:effector-binding domain-containing protein
MKRTILYLTIAVLFLCSAATANPVDIARQNVRVTVKEIEPFSYCSVPHSGSFGDLSMVINSLLGVMMSQNISPSGDLIAIYHISPEGGIPENIQYEVGFPITAQALPTTPLMRKDWSYALVAAAEHRGPYDGLADVIDRMLDWIVNNQYQQDGPLLGRFLVIPSQDVRPRDLRTEIWIPIKKK